MMGLLVPEELWRLSSANAAPHVRYTDFDTLEFLKSESRSSLLAVVQCSQLDC